MLKKMRLSGQFAMKLRMETKRERRLIYLINIIHERREEERGFSGNSDTKLSCATDK